MAKITKSNAQVEALKYINDSLKILNRIESIDKKSLDGNVTVKVGDTKVATSDVLFAIKIAKLLKSKLIVDVKAKCLKFNIDLDDSEKRLLGEVIEISEVEQTQEQESTDTQVQEDLQVTEEINESLDLEQQEKTDETKIVHSEVSESDDFEQEEISTDLGLEQPEIEKTDFDMSALGSFGF